VLSSRSATGAAPARELSAFSLRVATRVTSLAAENLTSPRSIAEARIGNVPRWLPRGSEVDLDLDFEARRALR